MNRTLKVTRLHLNKPESFVGTPLYIVATVMLVTVVIQLALQRAGADPALPEYAEGARNNSGILWSFPGFLIYYGVQAVATTYPFALALGTTRRNFVLGTVISNMLMSAYVSLVLLVLLGIELATNHWFFSLYVIDVNTLGAGDPLVLLTRVFLGVFTCLTIGGFFGAIWVRFGAKGPAITGLALGLVLALGILIIAPNLVEIVSSITTASVVAGLGVVLLLTLFATWFAMRRASVR